MTNLSDEAGVVGAELLPPELQVTEFLRDLLRCFEHEVRDSRARSSENRNPKRKKGIKIRSNFPMRERDQNRVSPFRATNLLHPEQLHEIHWTQDTLGIRSRGSNHPKSSDREIPRSVSLRLQGNQD